MEKRPKQFLTFCVSPLSASAGLLCQPKVPVQANYEPSKEQVQKGEWISSPLFYSFLISVLLSLVLHTIKGPDPMYS